MAALYEKSKHGDETVRLVFVQCERTVHYGRVRNPAVRVRNEEDGSGRILHLAPHG